MLSNYHDSPVQYLENKIHMMSYACIPLTVTLFS